MAKKKTQDFKQNLERDANMAGYHKQQAVLLDTPYLEDCFTQDLTAGATDRNAVKQGWAPTWSRYTSYSTPNKTRPGVLKQAEEMDQAYDEEPTDGADWKEAIIFGKRYR